MNHYLNYTYHQLICVFFKQISCILKLDKLELSCYLSKRNNLLSEPIDMNNQFYF